MSRTKDGRILKSSTIFLKDEDGQYRYLFGINYDITNLVNIDDGLRSLITHGGH
jgi:predicted transcriptional regulator YheO